MSKKHYNINITCSSMDELKAAMSDIVRNLRIGLFQSKKDAGSYVYSYEMRKSDESDIPCYLSDEHIKLDNEKFRIEQQGGKEVLIIQSKMNN